MSWKSWEMLGAERVIGVGFGGDEIFFNFSRVGPQMSDPICKTLGI